jgi:hypothetical protein
MKMPQIFIPDIDGSDMFPGANALSATPNTGSLKIQEVQQTLPIGLGVQKLMKKG